MFGKVNPCQDDKPQYERKYVRVIADHYAEGGVCPRILFWLNEDGVEVAYRIDNKPKGTPAHARKAGGQGMLFRINIRGWLRDLFYDDFEGRFFVEHEKKKRPKDSGEGR